LVLLDEIQKIPTLMDVIQDLIDRHQANFVLTGSSARKLRRTPQTNLLPGRVVSLRLDPLTLTELPKRHLRERLAYGDLPGIVTVQKESDRQQDLDSYVTTYLEEEVRMEALVRNMGTFGRFLELAAAESGQIVNLRKLSQEIGVAHTTIGDYYQILEDCLVVERVEPYTQSRTRRKLTKSQKYLFFDLGVRRVAANEGALLPQSVFGHLFEQMVGLDLIRLARLAAEHPVLRFWRDPDGPEVDWVLEFADRLIPIETKWTSAPTLQDARHLNTFLGEYPMASKGYIVCQTPRPLKLSSTIEAIPWQDLPNLI
jgi:predicted AAA+ superfamily ATPase